MKRLGLALLAMTASCSAGVGSVGAVLAQEGDSGALYVREVPSGLAADEAGLVPGDEIIMIEGRYVRDLDTSGVRALLRGEPGTRVVLTVVRGEEVRRVEVKRTPMIATLPPARPRD